MVRENGGEIKRGDRVQQETRNKAVIVGGKKRKQAMERPVCVRRSGKSEQHRSIQKPYSSNDTHIKG